MIDKATLPQPLECSEARQLFRDFLLDKLGAEKLGRIKGHLLSCEQCADAFAEEIEAALSSGELPAVDVPPLKIPDSLSQAVAEHPRFGLMWQEVVALVNQEKDWAKEKLSDVGSWFEQTIAGQWVVPVRVQGPARTRGGQRLYAAVIGASGEPTGATVTFEIADAARITENGAFEMSLRTQEQDWFGARLVCTLKLMKDKKVSFESRVGQDGSAKFLAQGLPQGRLVNVPRMDIELYLFSAVS